MRSFAKYEQLPLQKHTQTARAQTLNAHTQPNSMHCNYIYIMYVCAQLSPLRATLFHFYSDAL